MATNHPISRGFPNLPLVRDALKRLVPRVKDGSLPPPPSEPWDGWREYDTSDPIISAQRVVRAIAQAYRLDIGTVVVTFVSHMEAAGQVEISPGRDYFVELRDELKGRPTEITACLGHEVAHIFLHRHRLDLPETLPNEILTDVTAAIYGFGAAMADTYRVDVREERVAGGVRITRTERALGYLTPDELGYVLTRSGFARVEAYLRSTAAQGAMRVGKRHALRELTSPPLRFASIWRRLLYLVLRWWRARSSPVRDLGPSDLYAFDGEHVVFRCPVCCQGLRLPQRRALQARCPTCETRVPCLT